MRIRGLVVVAGIVGAAGVGVLSAGEPPKGAKPAPPKIGTQGPITVEAAAPDGSWVLVCQARKDTDGDGKIEVHVGYHGDTYGDRLDPYLIVGSGPGDPIDVLVDVDQTGRYVAAIKQKKLVVIDTKTRAEVDLTALGADLTDDGNPFAPHRAASFDAAGKRVLYLKKSKVVVRELATGTETEIDPGTGLLWRAELQGEWVLIRMIPKDSDGNGKIEWPTPRTSLSDRACRGPITSYSTYGQSGDDPETRVAALGDTKARTVADLVRPMGAALIRRAAKGELLLEQKDGTTVELAPRPCGARILGVHEPSGTVLVACVKKAKKDLAPVELHSATAHRDLKETVSVPDDDNWYLRPRRLIEVTLESDDSIVDLERGTIRKLGSDDFLVSHDERALVRRKTSLIVVDVVSGKETVIATNVETGYVGAKNEALVSVGTAVYDLVAAKALGTVSGEIHALAPDGRALVVVGTAKGRFDEGPLEWMEPRP